MGYSTINIPFFTDDITIKPHTATHAKWLNQKVSVKRFSKGERVGLEQIVENKEYIIRNMHGEFIQGPEV